MKKTATFLVIFSLISLSSFSQVVKDKLDKEHNAANKANAAKADVIIQKKKLFDSSTTQTIGTNKIVSKKTPIHKKKKKKLCNHKKNTH